MKAVLQFMFQHGEANITDGYRTVMSAMASKGRYVLVPGGRTDLERMQHFNSTCWRDATPDEPVKADFRFTVSGGHTVGQSTDPTVGMMEVTVDNYLMLVGPALWHFTYDSNLTGIAQQGVIWNGKPLKGRARYLTGCLRTVVNDNDGYHTPAIHDCVGLGDKQRREVRILLSTSHLLEAGCKIFRTLGDRFAAWVQGRSAKDLGFTDDEAPLMRCLLYTSPSPRD